MIQQLIASRLFWWGGSLVFASFYSLQAIKKAFSSQPIIQDDARQYLFWMLRFFDGELFPNDLIADYFQSVTPDGYTTLFRLLSGWGVSPLLLHKLLPLILALILTSYGFFLTLKIFPLPFAGFTAMVLLNQSLWFQDDLASATPRAFVYPLFLAFLYYFLSRNYIGILSAIGLLGTFYPQYIILSAFLLFVSILLVWRKKITDQNTYIFLIITGLTCVLVLLPYALETSEFQPVITREQALVLPEFYPDGRSSFFFPNPIYFWLFAERSGLIPALMPPLIWLGLLLPILCRFPTKFPLVKQLKETGILLRVLLASLICWLLAHLLLFRLHLPSRYTDHSGRIMMAIAGGITITIFLSAGINYFRQKQGKWLQKLWRSGGSLLLVGILFFYPILSERFPMTNYRPVSAIELYNFLEKQPKNSLIASLTAEANYIPMFAKRSVLVAEEYAIPYHLGYYSQLRDRALALITAQYAIEKDVLIEFIQDYKVDFFLLEDSSFTLKYLERDWLQQYPEATEKAVMNLKQGKTPILSKYQESCTVFKHQQFTVISSDCILSLSSTPN
ncbi:hypothetical protein [Dactylococcopsis salina]|uniref:Glycosyltransferase RgtA/B/C/D-like domain-containing protein n=1 Tax=Dactylococcopsis salina (strain PCC 8305) TaxID=13035 RepID=K9YWA6_DACS8|nr:hypothetical protein [Dactylococcopsis salina]AFZ51196.1 hypothetical protein Dacsa_2609 [Dactylococcopsis salina PCC 8305]